MSRWRDAARPFEPGAYDYLGAQWPDMQEFLEARGLTRAHHHADGESPG